MTAVTLPGAGFAPQQYALLPMQSAAAAVGDSTVTLTVNGKAFTADLQALGPLLTLNEFIRRHTPFRGTKRNCGEGGCGSCVVMMTDRSGSVAINSCLRPVASCNGKAFTTTEGIGSAAKGYHPLQTGLAAAGGSQCGYCSPGFTMSMYSLLAKGGKPSKMDIEEALHGNICRCTGFRPIVQADHKYAETGLAAPAPEPPRLCTPVAVQSAAAQCTWLDMTSEAQLAATLTQYSKASPAPKDLMLVSGRTSQGIWKTRQPDVVLNIGGLAELKYTKQTADGFEIGSGTSISDVIAFLKTLSGAGAAHMPQLADHYLKVAATPIRNAASIGGNVMLTHLHQARGDNFAYSDVTTCLYGLGAKLLIKDPNQDRPVSVSFDDFYAKDMTFSYLVSITIPFAAPGEVFKSYRIAARTALSHPFAVAAFRATVDANGVIAPGAAVVVGGCDLHPTQKAATAAAMAGKTSRDINVFRSLAAALADELAPTPEEGRVEFRKTVAVNFFYKFFLALQPSLPADLRSAAQPWFARQPLQGNQTYDAPDKSMSPVTQPEPKINAVRQCAGEAQYTGDIPEPAGLIHVAPVLSTALGDFSIDTSAAEAQPGWEGIFTSADINTVCNDIVLQGPLIAHKKTVYLGQVVALVMADSPSRATACARAVKVTYTNTRKPLVDLEEAIRQKSFFTNIPFTPTKLEKGDAKKALRNAAHTVKAAYTLGEQYHFHMETHTALATVKPDGFGLKVYSATQAPGLCASEVASACLGLAAADVTVETLRCGGAYGGKIFNSFKPACWAAVVTHKEKRPAKVVMEIDDNMRNQGMRCPWRFEVEVAWEADGAITAVQGTYYCESGHADLEISGVSDLITTACDNCYDVPNWDVKVHFVKTDVPPNTPCRGPGFVPAVFVMEQIIAQVARESGLSEDAVRARNYYKANAETPSGAQLTHWANMEAILARVKATADYDKRAAEVAAFNKANRFVKRGLSLTPVKYPMGYDHMAGLYQFDSTLTLRADGSVLFSSSGVEVGQGLQTKCVEVAAWRLGIDEKLFRIVATDTNTLGDLGSLTGYSTTSELCELATSNACAELTAALAPVRASLPAGATWQEVAAQAQKMGVKMTHTGKSTKNQPPRRKPDQYQVYCVAIQEIALDCLTGEVHMVRTDILEDAGRSVNPLIDVGQVEGGYLMGVGYALTEDMFRDAATGLKAVHNTWEYHVPTIADIPETWNTGLLKGMPNPDGILKTKATAEPPVCMGLGVVKSVSAAVSAFNGATHVQPGLPFAVDARQQVCAAAAAQRFAFQ